MAGGTDGMTLEIIDLTSSTVDDNFEPAPRHTRGIGRLTGVVVTFVALALPPVAVADVEESQLRVPHPLHLWAADHHVGRPPEGVVVPEPTCGVVGDVGRRVEVDAVRQCLREAIDAGRPAVVHESFELSYPDAADVWTALDERGRFRRVERWVSAAPPPDLQTGFIAATDLRVLVTVWTEQRCESGAYLDGDPDSSSLDCAYPSEPRSWRWRRPTTEAERDDLIARFVCTYEVFEGHEDC